MLGEDGVGGEGGAERERDVVRWWELVEMNGIVHLDNRVDTPG